MDIALWVVSGILAVVFLAAGLMKALQSKEKILVNPQMGWAGDFSERQITAIGVLEVLGAIGLIGPWLVGGGVRFLTPLAAVGLAVTMAGAIVVHARRKEMQALPVVTVLLVVAVVVAVGRFGQL